MEMPFMQEYMKDEDFVPIPVERETYYYLPPEEPPRPMLEAPLEIPTIEGLGEFLLAIYAKHVLGLGPSSAWWTIPRCWRTTRPRPERGRRPR